MRPIELTHLRNTAAMDGDSQVPLPVDAKSNSDDERLASQQWDPKFEGSQEPGSHKASPGESGGSVFGALVTSAMPVLPPHTLYAEEDQPKIDLGTQLAVVPKDAPWQDNVDADGSTAGFVIPSQKKQRRTKHNRPEHLSDETWVAGVDYNKWLGFEPITVRWAPPEAWQETTIFVHATATAGDVKHFMQEQTNITHNQCTLVGARSQKIPYWMELLVSSKENPDPAETKVLVPTPNRFTVASSMNCICFIVECLVPGHMCCVVLRCLVSVSRPSVRFDDAKR